MVKQAAHDSLDECSNHSGLKKIRMLKLVDSTSLSFVDESRIGSNPFSDKNLIYNSTYTLVIS